MRIAAMTVLVALASLLAAHAQNDTYDYYLNNSPGAEETMLPPDDDLFLIPIPSGGDPFGTLSRFNFSSVKYSRRGYGTAFGQSKLGALTLAGDNSLSPDRTTANLLRRAGVSEQFGFGPEPWDGRVYNGSPASAVRPGHSAGVFAYDRRGRAGFRLSSAATFASDWNYMAWFSRRWGRDRTVRGVFTDENSYMASVGGTINEKHTLSFTVLGTIGENGLRSYATKEAFALTRNNYYNPSWGRFEGKQRNSRVAKDAKTFIAGQYIGKISSTLSMSAAAGIRLEANSRSGLGWFDADNPYPDYYRRMPSYAENAYAKEEITDQWKKNVASTVNIDWDELYRINAMNGERAVYFLENRNEKVAETSFYLGAVSTVGAGFTLGYGVDFTDERVDYYKTAKDLLGGQPFPDVDQYLMDDEIYGDRSDNDLRNPSREVGAGNRFGYDYRLYRQRYGVRIVPQYRTRNFRLGTDLSFGNTNLYRKGNYEKALFPGADSYGKSDRHKFTEYDLSASGAFYFSPVHYTDLRVRHASTAPAAGAIFINPQYNNFVIDSPANVKYTEVNLGYGFNAGPVRGRVDAFFLSSGDQTAVYRYWDDLERTYSDMIASGINNRSFGIEAGMTVEITGRLSASAGLSVSDHTYTSDVDVEIRNDATQRVYVPGAKSYMKGYRAGSAPQTVATGELRYAARGWLATLTLTYAGDRKVDVTPLRRMERIYSLAGSDEEYDRMVGQQRLPDAFTVDIFILKSFYLPTGSLTVMASISNLLDNSNIIYNGYEQMRVVRRGSGVTASYQPLASKYLYSYGRTFYVALTYRF